jgi:mannose-6-phosphate isomerase
VKKGDVVFLPAGRVHALGKGCLVAEIQQNSDTTWRLHDYGRLENGKTRALHLNEALECIRFDAEMENLGSLALPWALGPGEEGLIQCPQFSLSRLTLQDKFKPRIEAPSYHLLTVIKGGLRILGPKEDLELALGSTALIPAAMNWSLEASTPGTELLWTRP